MLLYETRVLRILSELIGLLFRFGMRWRGQNGWSSRVALMRLSRRIITPLPTMSGALLYSLLYMLFAITSLFIFSCKKYCRTWYHPWSYTNLITLGHQLYPLSIHMSRLLLTLTLLYYVSLVRFGFILARMRRTTASSAGFLLCAAHCR